MKKKKQADHLRAVGRQTWQIKPVTRVVPNKKKAKPARKAKHKGRFDTGSFSYSIAA